MSLTKGDTKRSTSVDRIIPELVVEETENPNEEMKEDKYGEKELFAAVVDHPNIPLLFPALRLERKFGDRGVREGPLKTLEPPALSLIALEVRRLVPIAIRVGQIWVLV